MPLVDLLLQLFIAVVIFFPVVEYGLGIDLPKGTTDTIKQEQTRTLTVDRAGRVALNDVALSLPQLHEQLHRGGSDDLSLPQQDPREHLDPVAVRFLFGARQLRVVAAVLDRRRESLPIEPEGLARLHEWTTDMMNTSECDVDPMWTVLREGGPYHTRGRLGKYCEHLRATGRAHHADALMARHGHWMT